MALSCAIVDNIKKQSMIKCQDEIQSRSASEVLLKEEDISRGLRLSPKQGEDIDLYRGQEIWLRNGYGELLATNEA